MHRTLGVRVDDERPAGLVHPSASVERLGGGAAWREGPLPGEDAVIWSDVPGDRILRWTAETGRVTVDRAGVDFADGRTLDPRGALT